MPIYEYQCRSCGHRLEAMQRVSDPPLAECGECGGPLKKLVSAPAFQFKGSGWYVTDYAKKGGEKAESSGDGAADGSASAAKEKAGDSSGSESKPAKKEAEAESSKSKSGASD